MGLKKALCAHPVLTVPDFNKDFVVQTDASEVGLGAVLSQVQKGEEHPILYSSRKLFPHERRYSTLEKECLAVKWALETLRYYLIGRKFTLVTDHAPLQWMSRNKETNSRVTRWFLSLQAFNFHVVHRAGRNHGNADALSRRDVLWAISGPPEASSQRRGKCDVMRGRVILGRYIPATWLRQGLQSIMAPKTTGLQFPASRAAGPEAAAQLKDIKADYPGKRGASSQRQTRVDTKRRLEKVMFCL